MTAAARRHAGMNAELDNMETTADRYNRLTFNYAMAVVCGYMVLIAVAEIMGVFIGVVLGVLGHALLILVLLNNYIFRDNAPYRRALPALALAPLIRILGLIIPVREVPQIYWYALIGMPLLVAVFVTQHILRLSWDRLGLGLNSWPLQALIALSGLPLGLAALLLFRPAPLYVASTWSDIAIGSVIIIIFTGFTEEIIFRGVLHQVAKEIFGRIGIFYCSALYTIMYIGSLSLSYMLFMGLIGLYFGWCVNRTRSLWGVIFAHSILNIGMFFVWPLLWS